MQNRCGYCESMTKDIVCWECLKEMLEDRDEAIKELKKRVDDLENFIRFKTDKGALRT